MSYTYSSKSSTLSNFKHRLPSVQEARELAKFADTVQLVDMASDLRDQGFRNVVTYSRKVFIPLTQLCCDVCHYCTFAQTPKKLNLPT